MRLGDATSDNNPWTAQKPFGTDLLIAIATEDGPLFEMPRPTDPNDPNVEQGPAYLQAVKTAAEAVRASSARVVIDMIAVEVRGR